MDPFWIKCIYAPLAVGMAYLTFHITRAIVRAIKSGAAHPNTRLPIITRSEQPFAYWSYVISFCVLVIPASAAATIMFVGVVLGYFPTHP